MWILKSIHFEFKFHDIKKGKQHSKNGASGLFFQVLNTRFPKRLRVPYQFITEQLSGISQVTVSIFNASRVVYITSTNNNSSRIVLCICKKG